MVSGPVRFIAGADTRQVSDFTVYWTCVFNVIAVQIQRGYHIVPLTLLVYCITTKPSCTCLFQLYPHIYLNKKHETRTCIITFPLYILACSSQGEGEKTLKNRSLLTTSRYIFVNAIEKLEECNNTSYNLQV